MTDSNFATIRKNWREIASVFLKLGATAYGGPAIMGIMQAELQEKRQQERTTQQERGQVLQYSILPRILNRCPALSV